MSVLVWIKRQRIVYINIFRIDLLSFNNEEFIVFCKLKEKTLFLAVIGLRSMTRIIKTSRVFYNEYIINRGCDR